MVCLYRCPVTISKFVLPFGCTLHRLSTSLVKLMSHPINGDPFGTLLFILSSSCSRRVRNCDCHVRTARSICPLDFETRTGDSIIAVSAFRLMLTAFLSALIDSSWSDLIVIPTLLYPESSILELSHPTAAGVGPLASTGIAHSPILLLS